MELVYHFFSSEKELQVYEMIIIHHGMTCSCLSDLSDRGEEVCIFKSLTSDALSFSPKNLLKATRVLQEDFLCVRN